jgi:thioredoxin 1
MQWLIILLIALLLVLTVVKLRLLRRAGRQEESVAPPLNDVLPDGVAAQRRMLFYFYSEHCVLCRSVTPLIEELHRHGDEVVKVDVRRHPVTARRFGIRRTPSLVLVDSGRIAKVHAGAIDKATLRQFSEGHRPH